MYIRKKNIDKRRIDNMNSYVAGIDLGEKESYVTYMAPDGDIKEQFKKSCSDREEAVKAGGGMN